MHDKRRPYAFEFTASGTPDSGYIDLPSGTTFRWLTVFNRTAAGGTPRITIGMEPHAGSGKVVGLFSDETFLSNTADRMIAYEFSERVELGESARLYWLAADYDGGTAEVVLY